MSKQVYVRITKMEFDLELLGYKLGDVVLAEKHGHSYWICGKNDIGWQRYISNWNVKELDNCEAMVHLGGKCKKRINRNR